MNRMISSGYSALVVLLLLHNCMYMSQVISVSV